MNNTQLWYCDLCDKTIIFKSKTEHIISKTHKCKEKDGSVVIEYEFIKSVIDEVDYILNVTIKDCRSKYFHSFEYRCAYDNKFTKTTNN